MTDTTNILIDGLEAELDRVGADYIVPALCGGDGGAGKTTLTNMLRSGRVQNTRYFPTPHATVVVSKFMTNHGLVVMPILDTNGQRGSDNPMDGVILLQGRKLQGAIWVADMDSFSTLDRLEETINKYTRAHGMLPSVVLYNKYDECVKTRFLRRPTLGKRITLPAKFGLQDLFWKISCYECTASKGGCTSSKDSKELVDIVDGDFLDPIQALLRICLNKPDLVIEDGIYEHEDGPAGMLAEQQAVDDRINTMEEE